MPNVYVEERISKKTGRPYSVLVVDFGDYKFEPFLTPEQAYIMNMKLEQ